MGNDTSLEALLEATAGGDRKAFAALYARTSAKLFGIILRILRRRDWAEDVLQEVYLRIWDHARDFRPERGAPMTWMISIARYRALDWRRRDRGESALDEAPGREAWADPEPDPLDRAIASAEARSLMRCLEELDERQRACILLAYRDGYTHHELAARLDRPIGTVKSWIRRAQQQLKDCLTR